MLCNNAPSFPFHNKSPQSIHPKGLDAKKNRFDLSARIYTAVKRTTAFVEVIVKVREPERGAEWEQPGTMVREVGLGEMGI